MRKLLFLAATGALILLTVLHILQSYEMGGLLMTAATAYLILTYSLAMDWWTHTQRLRIWASMDNGKTWHEINVQDVDELKRIGATIGYGLDRPCLIDRPKE